MVTKWVPVAPNGIRTHRDLSHGGLPEAKNQLSKFGFAIFFEKTAPAGAATQEDRTCQKKILKSEPTLLIKHLSKF